MFRGQDVVQCPAQGGLWRKIEQTGGRRAKHYDLPSRIQKDQLLFEALDDLADVSFQRIDFFPVDFQALADFEARLADLELAVGAPIDQAQKESLEVPHE